MTQFSDGWLRTVVIKKYVRGHRRSHFTALYSKCKKGKESQNLGAFTYQKAPNKKDILRDIVEIEPVMRKRDPEFDETND